MHSVLRPILFTFAVPPLACLPTLLPELRYWLLGPSSHPLLQTDWKTDRSDHTPSQNGLNVIKIIQGYYNPISNILVITVYITDYDDI